MFNEMWSDQHSWKLSHDTEGFWPEYPECCTEQHYILGGDLQYVTSNADDICSVDYCCNHGST